MNLVRVIYEGGLEAALGPGGVWQIHPAQTVDAEGVVTLGDIAARHHLRPILATETRNYGEHLDLLLSPKGEPLELQSSALYSAPAGNLPALRSAFELAYDVGATVHHCKQLARAYAAICRDAARVRSIPGGFLGESDIIQFGYQTEPYYELDALLSAARRAYDKTGWVAWAAFGGRKNNRPDNLRKMLERRGKGWPERLEQRLQRSWTEIGAKLKDFRDCTQHFTSTDIGMGSVMLKRLEGAVWRASARLPDNPEVKSKPSFTYASGLDALTYGWEVTNEVVALSSEVVSALPE